MDDQTVRTLTSELFDKTLQVGEASSNLMSAVLEALIAKGVITQDEVLEDIVIPLKDSCLGQIDDPSLTKTDHDVAKLTLMQLRALTFSLDVMTPQLDAEFVRPFADGTN